MKHRILVVDDEPAVNELICDALHLAGFETFSAQHGMEALRLVRESHVDLIILDVNMPQMDGYEVLERLRGSAVSTPVIVLTARQQKEDTRQGFELGADDFVRKPFGIEELTLRVRAILRRSAAAENPSTIFAGDITLDADKREVFCGNQPVELSPTEFRLLHTLMTNTNRVLTKEQLLDSVWGIGHGVESSVVETYVSYLRKKFGPAIDIRTVRGVGYQLRTRGTAT